MHIQEIRSAAIRITMAGTTFLVDPWLLPKGAMGTFENFPEFRVCHPEHLHRPMPMVDLPMSVEKVLEGVDCLILTHLHADHIDMAPDGTVGACLPKGLPFFAQSEQDAEVLRKSGFTDVRVLGDESRLGNVLLHRTPARHGTLTPCGPASGVVFTAEGEKTLYVAGDTIWYEGVAQTIRSFRPGVIVVNACAAELADNGRLIMDDHDVVETWKAGVDANPAMKLVLSHMDTVAHATIFRPGMRERLTKAGIWDRVLMPADGETLDF